jgi:RNA recognition motif-containing protein
MSFDLSHEVPENMQGIIKSAVDIVNDDFDYYKFAQAFSQNDTWNTKPKSMTQLSPEKPVFKRNEVPVQNDNLRSCPSFRQPVFTFDEAALLQKEPQYPTYGIQRANSSSSDKLKQVMNENNIRQAIAELGNKNGVDLGVPILKVQLTGNPSYELDESDILNLFSRYGKVIRIEVGRNRSAFIVFDDIITALFAQKSLNGQYVKQLDVTIYVNWSSNIEEEFLRTIEDNKQQQMSSNVAPGIFNTQSFASPKNFNNVVPTFSYNPAKFTCKYEVQIENDKDFKIARKIIGPKVKNSAKNYFLTPIGLQHEESHRDLPIPLKACRYELPKRLP